MTKQEMINELRDIADILQINYGNNEGAFIVRELADTIQTEQNPIQDIIEWNKNRLLDKQNFVDKVEAMNILEEIIETQGIQSDEARNKARAIYELIDNGEKQDKEVYVDAYADIIVFATGALLKLGYDPTSVLNEVVKEISSRTGEIVDGKFVKCKTPECKAKWYKANFEKAKL